jgi:hypothetical protein
MQQIFKKAALLSLLLVPFLAFSEQSVGAIPTNTSTGITSSYITKIQSSSKYTFTVTPPLLSAAECNGGYVVRGVNYNASTNTYSVSSTTFAGYPCDGIARMGEFTSSVSYSKYGLFHAGNPASIEYVVGSTKPVVIAGLNGVTKTGANTYTANVLTPYLSTRTCQSVVIQGVKNTSDGYVPTGSALYSLPCNGNVYTVNFTSNIAYPQMALVDGPNNISFGIIGNVKTVK